MDALCPQPSWTRTAALAALAHSLARSANSQPPQPYSSAAMPCSSTHYRNDRPHHDSRLTGALASKSLSTLNGYNS